jgi:hypothetical protein
MATENGLILIPRLCTFFTTNGKGLF